MSCGNLLVLSASPQIRRSPDLSNVELMIPASASREPGWAVVSSDWNLWPVFQSQKLIEPLSPAIEPLAIGRTHRAVRLLLTSCEKDILLIDAHGVDDGIMTLEILHERALRALPLLDAPRATTSKGKL